MPEVFELTTASRDRSFCTLSSSFRFSSRSSTTASMIQSDSRIHFRLSSKLPMRTRPAASGT